MGFLNWIKGGGASKDRPAPTYLTHAERCALRRMTQHLDDGLIGYGQTSEWLKTFDGMADRLTLRFRDPFGDKPVAITDSEAKGLEQFQKMYARDVEDLYSGNAQMASDAAAIAGALARDGKPENLPAWEVGSGLDDRMAATASSLPSAEGKLVLASENGGNGPGQPSRTYSIFSDYPDRVLKTEADVKKDDALLEMTLVVNEIANDPDSNWRRYKGDFEKAVVGMREAFAPVAELKRGENSTPILEPVDDPVQPKDVTENGHVITSVSRGEWQSDAAGLYEFREHFGKSVEGYHGGLEISHRGGDCHVSWSKGYSTAAGAQRASLGMREAWEKGGERKRSEPTVARGEKRDIAWER